MTTLSEYGALIRGYVDRYLENQALELKNINQWGEETAARLNIFVNSGKQLRGSLAILSAEMYGAQRERALPIGAAMEFFQSAFLIHDDIMDRDHYRRGKKSLYFQYEEMARSRKVLDPVRAGESLGICLGDMAFFSAYELLNQIDCAGDVRQRIFNTLSREYLKVGLAQMDDVYFGLTKGEASEEEILQMYRYKTAHYTFSLPLMIGAIFAGACDAQILALSDMGEQLGLLFQIKDDELGLFGDDALIGKPVGSDIIEDKKTLFRFFLMQDADKSERSVLKKIFGSKKISIEQIEYVRELTRKTGVLHKIHRVMEGLLRKSKEYLKKLEISEKYREVFEEIFVFSYDREK